MREYKYRDCENCLWYGACDEDESFKWCSYVTPYDALDEDVPLSDYEEYLNAWDSYVKDFD